MPNKRLIWCICPSRTATATKCPIAFSKPPMKKFSSAAIALLGEYLILFEKGVRWEPHTNTSDRLDNTINRPHPICQWSVAHLVWEEIFSLSSQSNFTWGEGSKKGFSLYQWYTQDIKKLSLSRRGGLKSGSDMPSLYRVLAIQRSFLAHFCTMRKSRFGTRVVDLQIMNSTRARFFLSIRSSRVLSDNGWSFFWGTRKSRYWPVLS